MTTLNKELIYQVLAIVQEIPFGKVATYGQIAQLSGHPKNARLVGKILKMADLFGSYLCHRVVNSNGRPAPHFLNQKDLLKQEGLTFKSNGHVDLSQYQWKTK